MVELYLARHGQTRENVEGILQGLMPGHLTQEGLSQAHELAASLEKIHLDAIISSDLERAWKTARIIAEKTGCPLSPEPLLRERDWGSITGWKAADARGMVFPGDTETVEQMFSRARRLLGKIVSEYDGKSVLAVSHGLIIRVILACIRNLTIREVQPVTNCQAVRVKLTAESFSKIQEGGPDVEASN